MIKIAALDDEEKWIQTEKKIAEQVFKIDEFEFFGYTKAEDFLSDLRKKEYDIYLLDMELPTENGLSIGKKIKESYESAVIIYVTGHVEYAVEAYEVNAFRYIPKTMLEQKLSEALNAVFYTLSLQKEEYLSLVRCHRIEKIPIRHIYYMIKDKKYVIIIQRGGEYRVRMTLEQIQQQLHQDCFLKIDKGSIVNIDHVMSMEHYQVKMRDGKYLAVSHPQAKQVKMKIADYWRHKC